MLSDERVFGLKLLYLIGDGFFSLVSLSNYLTRKFTKFFVMFLFQACPIFKDARATLDEMYGDR